MPTVSEHPETLDQIQETIQKWLGHFGEHETPVTFSRGAGSSYLFCFISHNWSDLKLKTAQQWVFFEMKEICLKLNLDRFLVSTTVEGDKFCLNIEPDPEPEGIARNCGDEASGISVPSIESFHQLGREPP